MTSVAIVKTGRSTVAGLRHPSGRLKRQGADPIDPAIWHRIRTDAIKGVRDPRLATEFGRRSLHGEFTNAQTAAGFRYAELCGKYERINKLRRSVASPSYMAGFRGSSDIDEERLTTKELESLNRRREEDSNRYVNARNKLPGTYWIDEFERLVVEDEMVNPVNLPYLRHMLETLAVYFRSTEWRDKGTKKPSKSSRALREIPFSRFHEAAGASQAKPATTMAPTSSKRTETWLRVAVAKLRPDLDGEEIEFAARTMQALRDRERLRAGKAGK